MAELAGAIRHQRKSLGLTQIQLSELAGCGPAFIYDVERGKPSLRLDKLLDVLEVLGLELHLGLGTQRLRIDPRLGQEPGT
ncbi:MAG: helix-turn-helix transcriptional regulator [Myxococcales bacterium]|nr:helix-turn-helix transcriptional regulator [Myxococcales bacterium]